MNSRIAVLSLVALTSSCGYFAKDNQVRETVVRLAKNVETSGSTGPTCPKLMKSIDDVQAAVGCLRPKVTDLFKKLSENKITAVSDVELGAVVNAFAMKDRPLNRSESKAIGVLLSLVSNKISATAISEQGLLEALDKVDANREVIADLFGYTDLDDQLRVAKALLTSEPIGDLTAEHLKGLGQLASRLTADIGTPDLAPLYPMVAVAFGHAPTQSTLPLSYFPEFVSNYVAYLDLENEIHFVETPKSASERSRLLDTYLPRIEEASAGMGKIGGWKLHTKITASEISTAITGVNTALGAMAWYPKSLKKMNADLVAARFVKFKKGFISSPNDTFAASDIQAIFAKELQRKTVLAYSQGVKLDLLATNKSVEDLRYLVRDEHSQNFLRSINQFSDTFWEQELVQGWVNLESALDASYDLDRTDSLLRAFDDDADGLLAIGNENSTDEFADIIRILAPFVREEQPSNTLGKVDTTATADTDASATPAAKPTDAKKTKIEKTGAGKLFESKNLGKLVVFTADNFFLPSNADGAIDSKELLGLLRWVSAFQNTMDEEAAAERDTQGWYRYPLVYRDVFDYLPLLRRELETKNIHWGNAIMLLAGRCGVDTRDLEMSRDYQQAANDIFDANPEHYVALCKALKINAQFRGNPKTRLAAVAISKLMMKHAQSLSLRAQPLSVTNAPELRKMFEGKESGEVSDQYMAAAKFETLTEKRLSQVIVPHFDLRQMTFLPGVIKAKINALPKALTAKAGLYFLTHTEQILAKIEAAEADGMKRTEIQKLVADEVTKDFVKWTMNPFRSSEPAQGADDLALNALRGSAILLKLIDL